MFCDRSDDEKCSPRLSSLFGKSASVARVVRVPNFLGAALMLGRLGVLLLFVSRGM